tara:strand:+ start:221 stop:424 length:204 start_codon:yes stop_codon:yes gene_type:complete
MRSTQPHYDTGKDYDLMDLINDFNLNFTRGSAVKYIFRAKLKGKELQDLLKAEDCIKREIEFLRKKQ